MRAIDYVSREKWLQIDELVDGQTAADHAGLVVTLDVQKNDWIEVSVTFSASPDREGANPGFYWRIRAEGAIEHAADPRGHYGPCQAVEPRFAQNGWVTSAAVNVFRATAKGTVTFHLHFSTPDPPPRVPGDLTGKGRVFGLAMLAKIVPLAR
jgi:hypothetical protein